jgi:LysM repeat protein
VKVKVFLILVGVAALHLLLIAGFAITGGCKGPEVFAERRYIPVEGGAAPAAAVNTETKPEVKPEVAQKETPLPDFSAEKPVAPVKAGKAIGGSYTVQSGDNLGKIARKAGVSVSALAAANNMTVQKPLKIGQTLIIPSGSAVAASAPEEHKKPVHKKKTEAKKDAKAVKKEDVKADATAKDAAASSADNSAYTVKQGDNIWSIAKKLTVKGTDLAKANNLSTKTTLKIGQKLVVPGAAKKADAAPAEAAAETKKADAAADDILKNVSDPTAKPVDPTAKPVDSTTAAPAEAKAAPGGATAAPAPIAPIGKTDTVEVSKDIEIGKFAQQYGIKVDDIKKLNTDLPKDGILKAGKIIIIPSAE